jgi:uncharacterized protein YkwD
VFAAVALSALAMSAGFAVDRVLTAEPTGSISVGAEPQSSPQSGGDPADLQTQTTDGIPESTPSLKAVRRTPDTSRGMARTTRSTPSSASAPASGKVATAEEAVIELTNKARATAGCAPLRLDARLRTAARAHSTDMGVHDYFSHTSPNGDTFADRIEAAGYPHPGAENIARGYQTASAVMNGWMNSDGHRANILNCGLRAIGVGVYFGPGGPWWTQDFGWP